MTEDVDAGACQFRLHCEGPGRRQEEQDTRDDFKLRHRFALHCIIQHPSAASMCLDVHVLQTTYHQYKQHCPDGYEKYCPNGYEKYCPDGYEQYCPNGYEKYCPDGYEQYDPDGYEQYCPDGYKQYCPDGYEQYCPG
ncbi:hypothetical protein LSAT2_020557, partial [Lamellibrachia satsuma]